jgi:DNA-directed RNA polymerase
MQEDAVKAYTDALDVLMRSGAATGMKRIQHHLLSWYEPLIKEIQAEQTLVRMKIPGAERDELGPILLLLPVEKLAVITLNIVLNEVLKTHNDGESVRNLARHIGDNIQVEVNLKKVSEGNQLLPKWQQDQIKLARGNRKRVRELSRKMLMILSTDEWPAETSIRLGSLLLSMLLQTAKTKDGLPAYVHMLKTGAPTAECRQFVNVGVIRLNNELFKEISSCETVALQPRYLPMLVPPKPWGRGGKEGGYLRLKSDLLRSRTQAMSHTSRRAEMSSVFEALDYLGRIPWRVNAEVFEVVKAAYAAGELIGELPSRKDLEEPSRESCFTLPYKPASDSAASDSADNDPDASDEEHGVPEFNAWLYKKMQKRVAKTNAELHSLRCDVELKLSIADKFLGDVIYFPSNLDFRGRVYPIPPNLNHLGSDMSRALLRFAEPKRLGESGERWLKIQLCNLFGNNKISFDERVQWTEDNMANIFDSAKNPLGGERWWTTAESPFQALACCLEITRMVESGDPKNFMSSLPVHQDGSCNGLQHYAALGRDFDGGKAVNLVSNDADKPGDVYSAVLAIVLKKLNEDLNRRDTDADSKKFRELAQLVEGRVDRKVIKQTVMTSVYGVTAIGARDQIYNRLVEKFKSTPSESLTMELEQNLMRAAGYLARITLDSLGEMFSSANLIMEWLGDCASLVASKEKQPMSWMTPLGMPVTQPYRKQKKFEVVTVLQKITLSNSNEALPVCARKQRSAFPPNFVHSLDATHMLMTCLEMSKRGLTYASVHDSYWTYAADVPVMNEVLRSSFVTLYEKPILENLAESLHRRYPNIKFPPLPKRGSMNIADVLKSKYFFH